MRTVQINNSDETFTPTASGAIATHIWEVCRVAVCEGEAPLIISQDAKAPPFEGVETVLLPMQSPRLDGWRGLSRRLMRRLTGWREAEHRRHAGNVVRAIRHRRLNRSRFILHNDPEMAVYLKSEFPEARVVHHFHNPVQAKPGFRRRFRERVDEVTAVSRYVAEETHRFYGKVPVRIIYNGVDLERFKPSSKHGRQDVVVNFLGRTGIEKAPDLLLKACLVLAREGHRLCVQLVGSNHWGRWEADAYQRDLSRLGDELTRAGARIVATGHVSRAEVPVRLLDADIHVLPSRWEEPCALSLLEGMAAGLPVVASRTGGTPEILAAAGLLFARDSIQDLADRLRSLVQSPTERVVWGGRARRRAEAFTWSRCWAEFRDVLY
jgi:glycosyltransferase involved in cell wall biosynthesis